MVPLGCIKGTSHFLPKEPTETYISSDNIWWKRIWCLVWAICCLQRDGGRQTGGRGSLFYPKTNVLSPFHSEEEKTKKRKQDLLVQGCFNSFAELNHILNLYVCTRQIFVFWSFITFTLSSAPTAEAQVTPQDRTPRGVPSMLEATAREPRARKAFNPWPSSQRDELPYFHKNIKSFDYKDNSRFFFLASIKRKKKINWKLTFPLSPHPHLTKPGSSPVPSEPSTLLPLPQLQPQNLLALQDAGFDLSWAHTHSIAQQQQDLGQRKVRTWQRWCVLGGMTLLPYFSSSTAAGCAGLGASSAYPGVDGAILPHCPVTRDLHICAFILLRQCQQLPGVSLVNVCCATCQEAAKICFLQHTPVPRPYRREPLGLC